MPLCTWASPWAASLRSLVQIPHTPANTLLGIAPAASHPSTCGARARSRSHSLRRLHPPSSSSSVHCICFGKKPSFSPPHTTTFIDAGSHPFRLCPRTVILFTYLLFLYRHLGVSYLAYVHKLVYTRVRGGGGERGTFPWMMTDGTRTHPRALIHTHTHTHTPCGGGP